jgi:hypothetical protein
MKNLHTLLNNISEEVNCYEIENTITVNKSIDTTYKDNRADGIPRRLNE